eukprot:GHVR01186424.1.p1 GENE.GHVR01186424.1~~GHVR01186424.1.p1  ORF type:complete len:170 (+),score=7.53 GHVR01186424.1:485-994(+)
MIFRYDKILPESKSGERPVALHSLYVFKLFAWGFFFVCLAIAGCMIAMMSCMFEPEQTGIAATLAIFGMFACPLLTLGKVIQTRDERSLPFGVSFAMLVSNFLWALLGLLIDDAVVWLPSTIGHGLCSSQLLAFAWCKRIPIGFDLAWVASLYPKSVLLPLPHGEAVCV